MRIQNSILVHQPHFLPWPPYLALAGMCSTFVIQDDVQYRKGYYQNRTRIQNRVGQLLWATIPVHASSQTLINHVAVDCTNVRLISKIRNVIRDSYGSAASFASVWAAVDPFLAEIGRSPPMSRLSTVSTYSVLLLLNILRITPPTILFSSEIPSASESRTARLLSIIKHVRARTYLTGWGASTHPKVHDLNALARDGISVMTLRKRLAEPIEPDFLSTSGVSALHWIFHMGVDRVRDAILNYKHALARVEDHSCD